MGKTSIEWTDFSINPIRARHKATGRVGHYCEKIAAGCTHCYSSRMQRRFGTPEFGSGQKREQFDLFLDESKLDEVRRRKKPTRYFWCDMTDIFGDWTQREWLTACFETMDATPQHTHLLLTKRPQNVRRMWPGVCVDRDFGGDGCTNSLCRPNVWLGASVSDQATADELVPELLKLHDLSPVLFLSVEPLLGPVAIRHWMRPTKGLDWVIVGGESGPQARPCSVAWIRSIRDQCRAAGASCFVKQLGSHVIDFNDAGFDGDPDGWPMDTQTKDIESGYQGAPVRVLLRDRKGGDWSEWGKDLRVREFPEVAAV